MIYRYFIVSVKNKTGWLFLQLIRKILHQCFSIICSKLSTRASVAPSVTIETVTEEPARTRRATVLERLEQKLKPIWDAPDGKPCTQIPSPDAKSTVNRVLEPERPSTPGGSSPKIQEGLVKRLEQTREKTMLGELKFAAKIHKRRNESPTPLKAIPSELSRAEAIAAEVTTRREHEAQGKSRSGVVNESPDRVCKTSEGTNDIGSLTVHKTKTEVSKSVHSPQEHQLPNEKEVSLNPEEQNNVNDRRPKRPPREQENRRALDSRVDNTDVDPKSWDETSDQSLDERSTKNTSDESESEKQLKSFFKRHYSLRSRYKMANSKFRTRHNSGGEEQTLETEDSDTPAVQSALQKYRESRIKQPSSDCSLVQERVHPPPVERKSFTPEKRRSPASSVDRKSWSPASTSDKKCSSLMSSSEKHLSAPELASITPSTVEKTSSPSSPLERKGSIEHQRASKLPSSRSTRERRTYMTGQERRNLPDTPSSTKESSPGSATSLRAESHRSPPSGITRPSRDSGLRTRSPSPAQISKTKEGSPGQSPSAGRLRSERSHDASPSNEGFARKGSIRRRTPSSGSEQNEDQRSSSSSPRKLSSDESQTSTSKSGSSCQAMDSSNTNRHGSPSGIPLPVQHDHSPGSARHRALPPTPDQGDQDIVRQSRSRRSAREPRTNNSKVEVGQRSSSVGAVVDRNKGSGSMPDTVIVTDKPPMAKRDSSRENVSTHKGSRENVTAHKGSRENVAAHKPPISRTSSKEDVSSRRSVGRRRTVSEQSATGSSEDDDGSLPRSVSRESFSGERDRRSSCERSGGSGDMSEALQVALLTPAKTSPRDKEPPHKKNLFKHKR